MKEQYIENLKRIPDLEERRLLRDIINSVVSGVLEYDEEMFQKLEERVFEELEYKEMYYNVDIALIKKEDYDPIHESLFPICFSDLKEKDIDFESFIKEEKELYLDEVFLECDYLILKEILEKRNGYSGKLITDKQEHQIKVEVRSSKKYLKQIEILYDTFQKDGIPWVTINGSYLFKFADIIMTECNPPIGIEEKYERYSIEYEQINPYIKLNRLPLWNIETYQEQTMSFPTPILDGVNYEHIIPIKQGRKDCGYLVIVPNDLPCYMHQNGETIIITAPIDTINDWNLMRIVPRKDNISQNKNEHYPIMGNRMKDRFLNRLDNKTNVVIKTKGELLRIVSSFEAGQDIELVNFYIQENLPEIIETYSMNFFLTDGIRQEAYKKCMILEFIKNGMENVFDRDKISFLVSVIQMIFPDYICLGKLIKEEKIKI